MWLKLISFLLLTQSAWGYRFTQDFNKETGGFYWQVLPISISIIEADQNRKKILESLSLAAIMDWEDRTGLSLWSPVESGTQNIIRWSTNFAQETRMDPSSVLAVAIRYTNGPYFAKAEIVINGNHPLNQNESLLRTTITHELGHTMGLDHSEIGEAIMAPTLQPWYTGLHVDDVEGMLAAHTEMMARQEGNFISRFSFKEETTEPKALSCGTLSIPQGPSAITGQFWTVGVGFLLSFIGKALRWIKSLF
jgi:hypothetical protein